ncbi:hypothetical protein V491_00545 [Pseudogymnoascus sp. VKM F-3775]|nr:hypothetical protein V491_00545 [Pseudogymnoascus sp. VKM F-3775]
MSLALVLSQSSELEPEFDLELELEPSSSSSQSSESSSALVLTPTRAQARVLAQLQAEPEFRSELESSRLQAQAPDPGIESSGLEFNSEPSSSSKLELRRRSRPRVPAQPRTELWATPDPVIERAIVATQRARISMVRKYTKKHDIQHFNIGAIVSIKVPQEDRTSTDNKRLFAQILEEPYPHRYRILTASGIIQRLIPTKSLGVVEQALWVSGSNVFCIPTNFNTVGFHDVNSARVSIAEMRLYQCDNIFVVTDISRASTNQGVRGLLVLRLGANFNSLRRSQGVAIVCTKSEIFCVSNNLYSEAQAEGRELEARRMQSGRRSSANERKQAIQAKLDGSGIIELQEFCQDIPSRSQIAETRHFLNTRVVDLLQKVEFLCNARDTSEYRRKAPVEILLALQTKLENDFKASLETSDKELHDAKVKTTLWALSFAESLSTWNMQTLDAFWRQDGAHKTLASRGGNHQGRKLFTVMKDLFLAAMDNLLDEASKKLKAATDECCENISVDLRLLDVVAPAVDQGAFIQTLSSLLGQLKIDRDQAQREFDSQFPGPAQSV